MAIKTASFRGILLAMLFLLPHIEAHAADTCHNVCRKLDQCKLKPYDECVDYCSSHPLTDRGNDRQSTWSCQKLASFVKKPAKQADPPEEQNNFKASNSGNSCPGVCKRMDQCNLWSYGPCMDYCNEHPGDPSENRQHAQMSCSTLSKATGFAKEYRSPASSGAWSCRVVGTYVHGGYNGAPDYSSASNIDVTEFGRTRDLAATKALKSCGGIMSVSVNAIITPGSLTTDFCHVLRCSR